MTRRRVESPQEPDIISSRASTTRHIALIYVLVGTDFDHTGQDGGVGDCSHHHSYGIR